MEVKEKPVYNLEERTERFAKSCLFVIRKFPKSPVNSPLISQFVRSSSSIGANYCEANEAESRSDFAHKIGICKKEAKETKYWIRLILELDPTYKSELLKLLKEVDELVRIFSKIIKSTRAKTK